VQLKDSYPAIKETYRDRERYNGHIFLVRLEDGTTAEDADGRVLKFDHPECVRLMKGESIADVVNSRPGVYPPAPKPDALDTFWESMKDDQPGNGSHTKKRAALKDAPAEPPAKKRGRPRSKK
jgi:hypothetical protein